MDDFFGELIVGLYVKGKQEFESSVATSAVHVLHL